MKVVYVAGPFRAPTAWGIEQNIRRVEALGYEVARLGAMPLMPHANTRFSHGEGGDRFWIEGTLELLRRCDAVLVADRWEISEGTRGEVLLASERGLPVFYGRRQLGDLGRWLAQFDETIVAVADFVGMART